MEEKILQHFWEGVQLFLENVNWIYVACLMFWSWAIISIFKKKKIKFITNMATTLKVLIIAIVIAAIFIWLFDIKTKSEYARIFFGIPVSMFIWEVVIKTIFKKKKSTTNDSID